MSAPRLESLGYGRWQLGGEAEGFGYGLRS